MRTILDLCIAMDDFTRGAYRAMAASTSDPDLSAIFTRMANDEETHLQWWRDLIDAWDKGLLPDVVNDTEGLELHMRNILSEMQTTAPADFESIPDDVKLEMAIRLEFAMLDPVFGELLDLTEPGHSRIHREDYARHLERVIEAVEAFYTKGELARFLTRVLKRTWRDNLAVASYASCDPLTALYNQRGLMTHLNQMMSWAKRYGRPLGLLLLDIDDLKHVNDTHGRTFGDVALKAVAEAIAESVRGSDVVARYGGDEFAVVAPETGVRELATLAGRLVHNVSLARLSDWDGGAIPLRVSVGGAVATGVDSSDATVDGLLAAADRSLYEAKQSGKGRTGEILAYQTGGRTAD